MSFDPLAAPCGALAKSTERFYAEDSLQRAVALLRGSGAWTIPVEENGEYRGAVTEFGLARALAEGAELSDNLSVALELVPTISAGASGAEALRRFNEGMFALVVLDAGGGPAGVITPSDLFPRALTRPTPPMVGGMATPFGVYLTSGSVSGGVSKWALVATGAFLISLLLVGEVVAELVYRNFPSQGWGEIAINAIPTAFFLLALRLAPLSGTHAAEHKVVHALERGEPLTPEVVARMPRVHPRCGTNLAVAMTMFLTIFNLPWIPDQDARLLIALLTTVFFWRWAGSFVQWAVTTSPPSRKQIEGGIRAAENLLDNYAKNRRITASPFVRIANSGILHVTLGASLMVTLAHFLNQIFKWGFAW